MSALFNDLNCIFDYYQGVIHRKKIKFSDRESWIERLKEDIESVFNYHDFNADDWHLFYEENGNPILFSIHYTENGVEDFYDNYLQFMGAKWVKVENKDLEKRPTGGSAHG